jgi:dCTP deaminase
MIPGVLPDHQLQNLFTTGQLRLAPGAPALIEGQIQPASLDVRLGTKAYRLQGSMLPGKRTVMESIQPLIMSEIDLTEPQLLERGAVYLIPLMETTNLAPEMSATASPKSSSGRLDIFVRLLTDTSTIYDSIPLGYKGPLYLEVMPLTFSILARAGDRLSQLRFRNAPDAEVRMTDTEVRTLHAQTPLIYQPDGSIPKPAHVSQGLWISIDLGVESTAENPIVGYRARHHTQPINLGRVGGYGWKRFWEPIYRSDCAPLILYPEEFYIFVSRERLCVTPDISAELLAYDTRIGELRVHYAGFFDPGFGYDPTGQNHGTPAVLEIRAHDVPCVLEHGQHIGRFVYERLTSTPEKLYGTGIKSNYANQGLKLAKQFVMES